MNALQPVVEMKMSEKHIPSRLRGQRSRFSLDFFWSVVTSGCTAEVRTCR